jgi:hypothetical protein
LSLLLFDSYQPPPTCPVLDNVFLHRGLEQKY